ncbi:hypothetical protein AUR64_00305 [Haloprofundus marisrubri]|uniref:Uncharacterized protein n=1 Tax=Haloprofundus marisrubri TaxID=1514971 RepID=A0A0W1RG93_9EURY|nr:hypothetical protein [Haloprofundus marisrubri]KTG11668.1 hypothetical protein AUR64_00305 [Haloprofundus marisrubri]
MRLGNRDGTPVDAVPFLVAASLTFALTFAFGPAYGLSLGLSLPVAVAASGVVYAVAAAGAYHRLVWTANPDVRREVPAGTRLLKLLYFVAAVFLLLLFLSILLL